MEIHVIAPDGKDSCTSQIQQSFVYKFIGSKSNRKNRVLIYLLVQGVCVIFTFVMIILLHRILSKNFILGLYYSPTAIIYCIPLLFLYINLSEINLVFTLQIISFTTFFILLAIFAYVYFGIFQPIFVYEFNRFQNNCQILGVKTINLHQNEKYTIIFATFQDENGITQLGQACASDNRYRSIFETNIQPYQFIYYNDIYFAYSQDQARHQFTFSQVKIPSWLCMDDQHLQGILRNNNQDQIIFPICRINQLKQQVGYQYQSGVSDIQIDENFFIISLSEEDPYFNQFTFIILNVITLIPLTVISPQFTTLYLISKLKQRCFPSKPPLKQTTGGRSSIINLQKISMIERENTQKDNNCNIHSKKNSISEKAQQPAANLIVKQKQKIIQSQSTNQPLLINNTNTQNTNNEALINNTLTNNEKFNLIFSENQLDNQFYFKNNQITSPNQQSPIIKKFLNRFSMSLKDDKSKNCQQKVNSSCDISNQSISINYYHENNLFHLEQYEQKNIQNYYADIKSENNKAYLYQKRFKSKNFTEEI